MGDPTKAGRWATIDVWYAPTGTTAPADNDTAPSATWVPIGFIDPEGLSETLDEDSDTLTAYDGTPIEVVPKFNGATFTFTGIEDNDAMFGLIYEGSATPGAPVGGVTTRVAKVPTRVNHAWLIRWANGAKKKMRIVPLGKVSAVALKDTKSDALGGAAITVSIVANSNRELMTDSLKAAS